MHSGTADAGHYYSYIKDRNDCEGNWCEFNDTNVLSFNISNLKNECFGGELEGHNRNNAFEWDCTKSRNAYILIYERRNRDNLDEV